MPDLPEPNPTPTQADLVARLDLMEAMIAEGRQATARCGWIFVLWGLVDLMGMTLQRMYPQRMWNWPVAICMGWLLQCAGFYWQRRRGEYKFRANTKGRALAAIWGMMGVTLTLYCFTGMFTHHGDRAYFSAIFMIIGMAHATSAIVLRWRAQGAVAALWWAGGVAVFFIPLTRHWPETIFTLEMLFGMVFFGLYMMFLERRTPPRTAANA
jgi:hypothetical protein